MLKPTAGTLARMVTAVDPTGLSIASCEILRRASKIPEDVANALLQQRALGRRRVPMPADPCRRPRIRSWDGRCVRAAEDPYGRSSVRCLGKKIRARDGRSVRTIVGAVLAKKDPYGRWSVRFSREKIRTRDGRSVRTTVGTLLAKKDPCS
jgi:hypothetical protein